LSTRNAFKKSCGKIHLLTRKACLYYIASGKLIHPIEEFAVKTVQIDRRQSIIIVKLLALQLSLQHTGSQFMWLKGKPENSIFVRYREQEATSSS
jgi:hypothetical protein